MKRKLGRIFAALVLFASTLVLVPTAVVAAAPGDAPVTGTLFVDFDRDGILDPGEGVADSDPLAPPAGITVTAFDSLGASVPCVVTSGAPATYSCGVTSLSGSDFRVEFELDAADEAAGYAPGPLGVDNGSSVQFLSAGETGDFATVAPSQCASSDDGYLFTTCFVAGDRDASDLPQDVLVGLNYDGTDIDVIGVKGDGDDSTALSSELGSVWGIAYDEWNSTVFTSAFLKRHSDLGSEGTDGLYWIDYPTGAWNSISLDSLGGTPFGTDLARDLTTSPFSHDVVAYDEVGSYGIGDIETTPDGRTLLVTNVTAKTVEVFDVSATATGGDPVFSQSIAITNPGCPDTANPDDYEIFAVSTVDSDNAYVGVTCTARTSQDFNDLAAFVVPVSLSTGQGASVLDVPLNYEHHCGIVNVNTSCGNLNWEPWAAPGVWAPGGLSSNADQPMLTDLEITADGSLVLGFADRSGHTRADGNYSNDVTDTALYRFAVAGDILHACNTSGDPDNPTWLLEGGAGTACDATANFTGDGTGLNTDHYGPAGNAEWYGEDVYSTRVPANGHPETSNGGLYAHPYLDEVVVSATDPLDVISGGLEFFNVADGSLEYGVELYQGRTGGYVGKAAGIGDVEGCAIPLEIGDFVWLDLNGDGIQDPGELPLAGVTVTLLDATGAVIATTVTDANGQYSFDSSDGLDPNTSYLIEFDVLTNTTPLPGGFTNEDLAETIADNAATGDDSDSDVVGGQIAMTTGDPGMNDHSFDAGFTLPFDLALTKQLTDGTNLGVVSPGDTVTFTITVTNQGAMTATDLTVTDYLPAAGLTLADPAWADQGDGTAIIVIPGPLLPGESTPVDISFTVDADASGSINNLAEISSADNDGDPSTPAPIDIDSTPDADSGNDVQPSAPNGPGDDVVNEDGLNGGDEDDHDLAGVTVTPVVEPPVVEPPIFDLAIFKQLADGTNVAEVAPGDDVTFTITVVNQGELYGADMTIVDYLPAGLTLNDADWVDQGNGTATIVVAGPLAPGASTSVDITFTVDSDAPASIDNFAEIGSATPVDENGDPVLGTDGEPIPDTDSNADLSNDDVFETDDSIDGNGLAGGDEDDHDSARLTVSIPELALTGVTSWDVLSLALLSIIAGAFALALAGRRKQAC